MTVSPTASGRTITTMTKQPQILEAAVTMHNVSSAYLNIAGWRIQHLLAVLQDKNKEHDG